LNDNGGIVLLDGNGRWWLNSSQQLIILWLNLLMVVDFPDPAQQSLDFLWAVRRERVEDVVLLLPPGLRLKDFEELVGIFVFLHPSQYSMLYLLYSES